MSDYLFGKHHERLDAFLVDHMGRPSREERFQNRMHTAKVGIHTVATVGPFMIGTGRVRAGGALVKAGHSQIMRSLPSRGFFSGYRLAEWTVGKTQQVQRGAETIGTGIRMTRQGRILQGMGIGGFMSGKFIY